MSEFEFVQATKEQAKARVALVGPSGSGKTFTALIMATVLAEGGPIGVIDSERGSASKYVGPFTFNRLNLYTYDPRDLVKALASAAASGQAVVVIDSLSRFWGGSGGMLEIVDNAAKRSYGGNGFGGWKEARPIENDMIEAMLGYPGHVIVTMRVKTAYEITKTSDGKTVPVKIGLAPEQRNGIEYEFDVVADMDQENNFTVSKSRCPELSGRVINRPGPDVGKTLLAWLSDGVAGRSPSNYRDIAVNPATTYEEMLALYKTVKEDGKLAAIVMDDTGRMVTLHDLITRKGAELAAKKKAAELAVAAGGADAAPAAVQQVFDPPETRELTEEEFVLDFTSRLVGALPAQGMAEATDQLNRALAAKVIGAGAYSELLTAIEHRKDQLRTPVAA
jgi:roadblock/LC7 domain-containing protein/energy-coupling factor transporter ATP-binding protein EcfA2